MRKICALTAAIIAGVHWTYATAHEENPAITAWYLNLDGRTGQSTDNTIDAVVSTIQADVQSVTYDGSNVYVDSTGIPSHNVGPFNDGNPSIPVDVDMLVRVPLTRPGEAGAHQDTGLGSIGVFINGVGMYNMLDAFSYEDEGVWNQNAIVVRADGMDPENGHPSPLTMEPPPVAGETRLSDHLHTHADESLDLYHTHGDLASRGVFVEGLYHYHQQPVDLRTQLGDDGFQHSPILGFVFDGVPIYGPYAYANTNGTGGIVRMDSSYRLRSISVRTSLPDGTPLAANLYGPAVSGTFPLGYYAEDFEYVNGHGDLDEFNGRFAVTPEYPGGVYAYYATIDSGGESAYPYLLGPQYYATPLGDNVTGSVSVPGGQIAYDLDDEADDLRDALSESADPSLGFTLAEASSVIVLTPTQFAIFDSDEDGILSLEELLEWTAGPTNTQTTVYVDFANGDPDQGGTLAKPFNTIVEADSFILHGVSSTVQMAGPNTTSETVILSGQMALTASGGTVRIGDSTP